MRWTMRFISGFSAGLLLIVMLTSCQTTPPAEGSLAADRSATDETEIGISPVNERSRRSQAAWAAAIEGLNFETGRVVVEQPPAAGDVAEARRFLEQGEQEYAANRRTETVAACAAAVRAAPDLPEAYAALGQAMIAKGKTDLAIACYRTVIDLQPENIEARVELANALAREMRYEEATTEMEAVLGLDPAHGPAHERLAIWSYYDEDYATAWAHVRAARAAGHEMPPQFITLLSRKMAEPGAR
jgi:tetratricopeptide (TPR) repeat protein